jgi:hypothetical protein
MPNPACDKVEIFSEESISSLELINISGQTVYSSKNVDLLSTQLDISRFKAGTYYLKINSKERVVFKMLIIE